MKVIGYKYTTHKQTCILINCYCQLLNHAMFICFGGCIDFGIHFQQHTFTDAFAVFCKCLIMHIDKCDFNIEQLYFLCM